MEFKSGVTVDVNEQAKKTNEVLEIRRRTRVVGTFPDGNSALMLVCARLRYGPASLGDKTLYDYELFGENAKRTEFIYHLTDSCQVVNKFAKNY